MIGALVAGRYRVEAELGRGGMGVVYRAVQLPMERPVALKVLRPELLAAPDARARFEREARVASALAHPAAVAIHELGEHDGTAFLAMELVEGTGLRAVLEAHPRGLATARAVETVFQLADALAAAHAAALVHRDLKPENVVVQADGRVRVLDFGLAFRMRPGPAGRMTREGVVVGTPDYVSPEQARGEAVGPPTDVYALGCVLHELLTGRPPFAGPEMEVLTKQMYAPAPALSAAAHDVPAALDRLRRTMLDKRPDARPSAGEIRDRLAALDPDPERARARARQDGYLGARAARMVDAPAARPEPSADDLEVAIHGEVSPDLLLGLSANGLAPFVVTEDARPDARTAAVYAPRADEARIAALAADGPPVVADADRGDMTRLSALLRAGAADVVLRPVSAADLARKLRRVAR
ncbi:MAG TPA: serine/threonine-protein kinase [Sandaracinaceae bacterium LLY-WYZ-13_1]|nr:serine/threonine-protein kinase [Sandaracinaceae bacterium LLY-WYZ-13_1]